MTVSDEKKTYKFSALQSGTYFDIPSALVRQRTTPNNDIHRMITIMNG